jgi:hypothetical protein
MHAGNPSRAYSWATVVGVVADTKLGARDEPNIDQWYSSALQPAVLGASSDLHLRCWAVSYAFLPSYINWHV